MSIRIDNQVTNQLSVPIMLANNYINRPTAGIFGRLFISNDTYQIYQDRVTYWSLIADAGAGSGTLQSVTDNGNTTTAGIYIVGIGTLSVQSLTNGSVLFPAGGSGQISQDNANFFWDNTNKRLGLGTATPGQRLDVHSSTNVTAQFNGTGVTNAVLQLQNAGTSKWSIGNYYNSGNNDFNIYDNVNTTYRAYFTNTGYAIFPSNVIIGSTNRSSSYGLDVYSSAYFRSSIYNLNYTQGSILFAGASGLINQNNSNFFWDNTNNRLGIGTATPSYVFDVNATANARLSLTGTTNFVVTNMNNTSGAFYSGIDDSGGANFTGIPYARFIYSGASYPFLTIVNGVQASKIFPNGNTIIGTTTTDNGDKLQVYGNIGFINSGNKIITGSANITTSITNIGTSTAGIGNMYFLAYFNNSGGAQGTAVVMLNATLGVTIISQSNGSGLVISYSASGSQLRASVVSGSLTLGYTQIQI